MNDLFFNIFFNRTLVSRLFNENLDKKVARDRKVQKKLNDSFPLSPQMDFSFVKLFGSFPVPPFKFNFEKLN